MIVKEKKICPKCKIEKLAGEFDKSKNRSDGLSVYCKVCNKEYREANKTIIAEQKKEYYKTVREEKLKYNKEYFQNNTDKCKSNNRKYYENNRQKIITRSKARRYRVDFGITIEDFEKKLSLQQNKCLGCGKEFTEKGDACLDHNHTSGKIRGILCRNCNLAVGGAKDNIEILKKVINYIIKYNTHDAEQSICTNS